MQEKISSGLKMNDYGFGMSYGHLKIFFWRSFNFFQNKHLKIMILIYCTIAYANDGILDLYHEKE